MKPQQQEAGAPDVRMPGIHEANVLQFRTQVVNEEKQTVEFAPCPAIDGMGESLKFAREGAETILKTHDAIMSDPTHTYASNSKRSRDSVFRIAAQIAARLDRAKSHAEKIASDLEAKISMPPPPANQTEADVESSIRNRLGALSDADRKKALASLDVRTVHAVLTSPPWLSGVMQSEHRLLKESFRRKYHMSEAKRLDAIKSAIDALESSGHALLSFVSDLTDKQAVALAEAAEARASAAILATQQGALR